MEKENELLLKELNKKKSQFRLIFTIICQAYIIVTTISTISMFFVFNISLIQIATTITSILWCICSYILMLNLTKK